MKIGVKYEATTRYEVNALFHLLASEFKNIIILQHN